MSNIAKCLKCDTDVANVHYESLGPSALHGYQGSRSYAAVAFPCGHLLSAVPISWEQRLDEIERVARELDQKISYVYRGIMEIVGSVREVKNQRPN